MAAHLNMLVILKSWRFNVIMKEANFSRVLGWICVFFSLDWAIWEIIIGAFVAYVGCSLFLPTGPEKGSTYATALLLYNLFFF